jgi:hypothetical protein
VPELPEVPAPVEEAPDPALPIALPVIAEPVIAEPVIAPPSPPEGWPVDPPEPAATPEPPLALCPEPTAGTELDEHATLAAAHASSATQLQASCNVRFVPVIQATPTTQ